MDRAVDGVRAIDIVERKERKGIVAARQRRDLNYGDTITVTQLAITVTVHLIPAWNRDAQLAVV